MSDGEGRTRARVTRLDDRRSPTHPPRRSRRPIAVLAGLAVLSIGLVLGLTLRVGQVRVVGLRELPASTVLEAAGLHGGERLLLTRLSAVASRVEAVAGIAGAKVNRELPSTVVITVTERVPLLRLSGTDLAVDRAGAQFNTAAANLLAELEGWTGKAGAGRTVGSSTRKLLSAYGSLPEAFRALVGRVSAAEQLTMTLHGGLPVIFGTAEMLPAKAAAAQAVVAEAQASGRDLLYVDVRAPRTPVAGERTPEPTAAPTSAPRSSPSATTGRPAGTTATPRTAAPAAKPVTPSPSERPATPRPTERPAASPP